MEEKEVVLYPICPFGSGTIIYLFTILLTCVVLCYSRGVIVDGRLRHAARPDRTATAQVQRFGPSQGTGQAQTAVVFFIFVPTGRLYHCINRQSNLIALLSLFLYAVFVF